MVEIALPNSFSHEFMELIPAQRCFVNNLLEQGIISVYSLALDKQKLWVVFLAERISEVQAHVEKFPIADYVQYEIHELAFHDAANLVVPSLSLN